MSLTIAHSQGELRALSAPEHEDRIIQHAIALLERRIFQAGPTLSRPSAVGDFLRLKLAGEPNEVFAAIFLNSAHEVLAYEPLFHGSITEAAIYPRVVVQHAMMHNAAALIMAHQHPSGNTEPSAADRAITQQLKVALAIIDVRVLDHLIIGKGMPYSFDEAGLL
ncbi:JAB domain-containing protein [Sodalis sp. RH19]|uniref:JAB domain-containing protein n=1 Tax=Sodalis sp. RH19 TaxID=3394334 RepID=UPI0039B6CAF3